MSMGIAMTFTLLLESLERVRAVVRFPRNSYDILIERTL